MKKFKVWYFRLNNPSSKNGDVTVCFTFCMAKNEGSALKLFRLRAKEEGWVLDDHATVYIEEVYE